LYLQLDWGQNSYGAANGNDPSGWQQPLKFYCEDDAVDVLPIAFVTTFFGVGGKPQINLANVNYLIPKMQAAISNIPSSIVIALIMQLFPVLVWPVVKVLLLRSSIVKARVNLSHYHWVVPLLVLDSNLMNKLMHSLIFYGTFSLEVLPIRVLLVTLSWMGKMQPTTSVLKTSKKLIFDLIK
jgi:hypothetical protein